MVRLEMMSLHLQSQCEKSAWAVNTRSHYYKRKAPHLQCQVKVLCAPRHMHWWGGPYSAPAFPKLIHPPPGRGQEAFFNGINRLFHWNTFPSPLYSCPHSPACKRVSNADAGMTRAWQGERGGAFWCSKQRAPSKNPSPSSLYIHPSVENGCSAMLVQRPRWAHGISMLCA